jgi:alanyl-tRNA synthetase
MRSLRFLIADGVLPSNEGRGYVLRRIMRRACATATSSARGAVLPQAGAGAGEQMGDAYPELRERSRHRTRAEAGRGTLRRDARPWHEDPRMPASPSSKRRHHAGPVVFKLYDTYGFPVDLTADIARERGLKHRQAGFEAAMQAQRDRARAAGTSGRLHRRRGLVGRSRTGLHRLRAP